MMEPLHLLIGVFVLLIYTYLFIGHNENTKFVIIVVGAYVVYNIYTIVYVQKNRQQEKASINYNLENMKEMLDIDSNLQWLEFDDYLKGVMMNMIDIIPYDRDILRYVALHLNKFLKRYYNIVSSNHESLQYKDIKKHQISLQYLHDINDKIMGKMKEYVFVLTNKEYYDIFDIPDKISKIDTYLHDKIQLVYYKYKIKKSYL